jgi:hypothetical protein
MKPVFLSLFFITSCQLWAQDYKKDLLAAITHMSKLADCNLLLNQKLYLDGKHGKAFQESSTIVRRKDKLLFCKMEERELVINDEYRINIDHKYRLMQVVRKENNPNHKAVDMQAIVATGLDSALKTSDGITVSALASGKICYVIRFKPGAALLQMTVTIDQQRKMLERVSYAYREKMKIQELGNTLHQTELEITYVNMVTEKQDPAVFNTQNYLRVDGENVRGAGKYSEYKLSFFN